jgi:hypothetical protein
MTHQTQQPVHVLTATKGTQLAFHSKEKGHSTRCSNRQEISPKRYLPVKMVHAPIPNPT